MSKGVGYYLLRGAFFVFYTFEALSEHSAEEALCNIVLSNYLVGNEHSIFSGVDRCRCCICMASRSYNCNSSRG